MLASRTRIARAAERLLARGARPSVEEIAAAAGVSRATFYRAYPSREALLKELSVEPDPGAGERILEAALGLLAERGLAELSMDGLAEAAGVSRATVYRLFPGKPALFEAVIRAYSPLEPIRRVLHERAGEPPDLVIPALARTVAETMEPRLGIVAPLFFQTVGGGADGEAAREWVLGSVLREVVAYLAAAMARGRLRQANPLLALQSLMGPIFFHLVTRRVVEAQLGPQPPLADVAEELSRSWLRAMRPEAEEVRT